MYIKKENNFRFWKCLSFLYSLLRIHKFHLISWCWNYQHMDIFNICFGVYRNFFTTKLGEISILFWELKCDLGKVLKNFKMIWLFYFDLRRFFVGYCWSLVLKIPPKLLCNCSIHRQLVSQIISKLPTWLHFLDINLRKYKS